MTTLIDMHPSAAPRPVVDVRDLIETWDPVFDACPCNVYLVKPDISGCGRKSHVCRIEDGKVNLEDVRGRFGGGVYEFIWYGPSRRRFVHQEALAGPNLIAAGLGLEDERAGGTLEAAIVRAAQIRAASEGPGDGVSRGHMGKVEKALEELGKKLESSKADRLQEMMFGLLTTVMTKQLERAGEPSPGASALVANVDAAIDLAERMNAMRDPESGATGAMIAAALPALLDALKGIKPAAAAALPPPAAKPRRRVEAAVAPSAAPPTTNAAPAPSAAAEAAPEVSPPAGPAMPPGMVRALATLYRMREAIAENEDPEEFAAWAADALDEESCVQLLLVPDAAEAVAGSVEGFDAELAALVRGPGKRYVEAVVAELKAEAATP